MTFTKYSDIVRNRGKYIEYISRNTFRLRGNLRYWIDYNHQNEYIDIPDGYIFDFNSSPCWAHCIVDRDEFIIALIHDILYNKQCDVVVIDMNNMSPKFKNLQRYGFGFQTIFEGEKTGNFFLYNRKFADKIWKEGALEESIQIERVDKGRKIFFGYIALRIGGSGHFRK